MHDCREECSEESSEATSREARHSTESLFWILEEARLTVGWRTRGKSNIIPFMPKRSILEF
jgi:hypothetical protein